MIATARVGSMTHPAGASKRAQDKTSAKIAGAEGRGFELTDDWARDLGEPALGPWL